MAELDKLGKAICGFLNTQGGIGLIGITNQGKCIGIEVTESTKNKLSTFCNHFEPWPELTIDYIPMETSNRQIIAITATPRNDAMPFVYRHTPYLRNEAQLKKMPVETYQQRLLKSSGYSELWESLPTKSIYTIDSLDHEEILKTVNLGLQSERMTASLYTKDVKEALITLDMLDDQGGLNHAAIVLFAQSMPADYPQCFLRMGRFTDERMNQIMDSRQIRGNAFQLLQEAENFIQKHLPMPSRYTSHQLERIDEPVLPFLAVREAIVNALIHRDYSNRSGDIALFIFNTHLEIHNIGHLYADMTIQKLKKRHVSRRRNPKIAQVFWIRQLIERHGSGTLRMIDLCQQQGLLAPEFYEVDDGFMVKFYFKTPIGMTQQETQSTRYPDLSEREKSVLMIIHSHEQLTFRAIMDKMVEPPSERTLRNDLTTLRDKGYIQSSGFGRGATWQRNKAKK